MRTFLLEMGMEYPFIDQIELNDKNILLRLDLNVPLRDGKIEDDTRIQEAMPTIKYLLEKNAKIVMCSHLGRPKGQKNAKFSLQPVGEYLAEALNKEVLFVADYYEEPIDQLIHQLGKNQLVLLENLRFDPRETANDMEFGRLLMKGMDCFINDAFGASHRAHASIVQTAQLAQTKALGFLIKRELEALSCIKNQPKNPFTVIVGGSKVSDKIGVIYSLLEKCNDLVIGGAMSYTFLKYLGKSVGKSLVEEDKLDLVRNIYRAAEERKVSIHLPEDHVCARDFKEDAEPIEVSSVNIPNDCMGMDIGAKTIKKYAEVISRSKTVLWNGPMGVFEWDSFSKGSLSIAESMATCEGYTVVGGGDSVAAVNKAKLKDKMSHVSTGGGASLEFLQGNHLPGLKAMAEGV